MSTLEAEIAELLGEKSGMPMFIPTAVQRQQVELMVGLGMTYKEIASVILNPRTDKGICTTTLQSHFREELDQGTARVKARVLSSLVAKACSKTHPQAAICAMFVAKCRFGWRQEDKVHVEVEAKSGVLVAPPDVTPADWIAAERLANRGRTEPGAANGHDGHNGHHDN